MLLVKATLICERFFVKWVEEREIFRVAYSVSVPVGALTGSCDSHTEAGDATEHVVSA